MTRDPVTPPRRHTRCQTHAFRLDDRRNNTPGHRTFFPPNPRSVGAGARDASHSNPNGYAARPITSGAGTDAEPSATQAAHRPQTLFASATARVCVCVYMSEYVYARVCVVYEHTGARVFVRGLCLLSRRRLLFSSPVARTAIRIIITLYTVRYILHREVTRNVDVDFLFAFVFLFSSTRTVLAHDTSLARPIQHYARY